MKDIDKMQNCQRMSRRRTIKELQIISSVVFIAIELVNFVQLSEKNSDCDFLLEVSRYTEFWSIKKFL